MAQPIAVGLVRMADGTPRIEGDPNDNRGIGASYDHKAKVYDAEAVHELWPEVQSRLKADRGEATLLDLNAYAEGENKWQHLKRNRQLAERLLLRVTALCWSLLEVFGSAAPAT